MRHLILLLYFFTNAVFAQTTTNVYWTEQTTMLAADVVYYNPNKKLVWADFKGIPAPPSPVAAITSSGFGYNANMNTTNGKGTINVSVYCYFTKSKSSVRPGKTTPYILTHEQHHFDASYLAAGIFVDKVKNSVLTTANINTLLPRLYKECIVLMNNLQNDYDGQTKNGQLVDKQEKWNAYFEQKIPLIIR